MAVFFTGWELWQDMTFVLACCIVVVFAIGVAKLWWTNRQLRKHETMDDERRARLAEMRHCGIDALATACAFDPETNPLNVPLVQVSLFRSESPHAHYALGRAVSRLRDEGVVIIGAGMTVHNLGDLRRPLGDDAKAMPYAVSFDKAVKEAVEVDPSVREETMAKVCNRPDARQAHPFMDHLMPLYIAAGAAHDDWGRQTWTMHERSLAWAQYRFGNLPRPS